MSNDKQSDLTEFCALWRETSASGREYFSGPHPSDPNMRLIAFPETDKRNERAPDLKVYVTPKRERRGDNGNGQ